MSRSLCFSFGSCVRRRRNRLLGRGQRDIAFAPPDAVASAFHIDDYWVSAILRLELQLLLVDPWIVLEPIILDRALRKSRSINMRVNVRRRGPMRIRAGPDRAKFIFPVGADLHPAV